MIVKDIKISKRFVKLIFDAEIKVYVFNKETQDAMLVSVFNAILANKYVITTNLIATPETLAFVKSLADYKYTHNSIKAFANLLKTVKQYERTDKDALADQYYGYIVDDDCIAYIVNIGKTSIATVKSNLKYSNFSSTKAMTNLIKQEISEVIKVGEFEQTKLKKLTIMQMLIAKITTGTNDIYLIKSKTKRRQ